MLGSKLAECISQNRFAHIADIRAELKSKSKNWQDAYLYENFVEGSMVSGLEQSGVITFDFRKII
jgi:hypothetical protein